MIVRIVELGPFGCRIDHGIVDDPDDIPEGYERRSVETSIDVVTVYVEPKRRKQ